MLYLLLSPYFDQISFLNLFRYLSFRSSGALFTALLLCLIILPKFIKYIAKYQSPTGNIREVLIEMHSHKRGTPSFGGIVIIISIIISTLLWADITNLYLLLALSSAFLFGFIGLWDDILKLKNNALSENQKLILQISLSIIISVSYLLIAPNDTRTLLSIPFFKNLVPDLGVTLFIFFQVFFLTAWSNAVNLTDGLDGLAILPAMIAAASMGIIAYLVGHSVYADYLQIISLPGSGELIIICMAIIGAGLGFLWYNAPPAQIFMGDTGAISLGGLLATIAIITKHEIVLGMVGGLFVLEITSVVLQRISDRFGYKLFFMTPIHHHFEKKGWSEATIVIRCWIVAIILALIGLTSLKIR